MQTNGTTCPETFILIISIKGTITGDWYGLDDVGFPHVLVGYRHGHDLSNSRYSPGHSVHEASAESIASSAESLGEQIAGQPWRAEEEQEEEAIWKAEEPKRKYKQKTEKTEKREKKAVKTEKTEKREKTAVEKRAREKSGLRARLPSFLQRQLDRHAILLPAGAGHRARLRSENLEDDSQSTSSALCLF